MPGAGGGRASVALTGGRLDPSVVVEVELIRAAGLAKADTFGLSDPFCEVAPQQAIQKINLL